MRRTMKRTAPTTTRVVAPAASRSASSSVLSAARTRLSELAWRESAMAVARAARRFGLLGELRRLLAQLARLRDLARAQIPPEPAPELHERDQLEEHEEPEESPDASRRRPEGAAERRRPVEGPDSLPGGLDAGEVGDVVVGAPAREAADGGRLVRAGERSLGGSRSLLVRSRRGVGGGGHATCLPGFPAAGGPSIRRRCPWPPDR